MMYFVSDYINISKCRANVSAINCNGSHRGVKNCSASHVAKLTISTGRRVACMLYSML